MCSIVMKWKLGDFEFIRGCQILRLSFFCTHTRFFCARVQLLHSGCFFFVSTQSFVFLVNTLAFCNAYGV